MLREKKYHSYRGEVGKIAPNLLKRDFKADETQSEMDNRYHRVQIIGTETLSFSNHGPIQW